jgi:hypothetical protein
LHLQLQQMHVQHQTQIIVKLQSALKVLLGSAALSWVWRAKPRSA